MPVLARGIYGFEKAKAKANELRKRYGLKWDDVDFKADRTHNVEPINASKVEESITPIDTTQARVAGSGSELI